MNQPVISLQNVSRSFRNTKALDAVSLEVPSGTVFALLGENGAGKTTLIRILTGFLKADEGSATVLGESCSKWAPRFAVRSAMCPTTRRCTSG